MMAGQILQFAWQRSGDRAAHGAIDSDELIDSAADLLLHGLRRK